jgi:hypothetical protein
MAHTRQALTWLVAAAVAGGAASLAAQDRASEARKVVRWEVGSVEPSENVPPIAGAPFTADATTEFTQVLADGNRIEQRFSTSVARDGRGRTRREQEMALVGPLAVLQLETAKKEAFGAGGRGRVSWSTAAASKDAQRLVVISDPVEHVSYTLYEQTKEALRSAPLKVLKLEELKVLDAKLKRAEADNQKAAEAAKRADAARAAAQQGEVVEDLGTRQIEGVNARGTRATKTIQAGEIGNLGPINLVTERWFSEELGMAVRITRSDPRSGETVYRLTNIVRAEPPPDLFTVPPDYKIVEPAYFQKRLEYKNVIDAGRGGRGKP